MLSQITLKTLTRKKKDKENGEAISNIDFKEKRHNNKISLFNKTFINDIHLNHEHEMIKNFLN
jgi:hypothetical protein